MSSKTIYDKVQEIKEEKDTKIIPGNIKKDVTVLGVTGTLEPSADINIFTQTTEPTTKEGIWLNTNNSFDSIQFTDNVVAGEEWDLEKITSYPSIPYNFSGYNCGITSVGTDVYLFGFGGSNPNCYLAYKYDTLTNSFTQISNIPTAFYQGSVTSIGTNIYLCSGSGVAAKYVYKYDTLTGVYTKLADASYMSYTCKVTSVGNCIYIYNGTTASKYDVTTQKSTRLTDVPYNFYGSVVSVGTDIYLLGANTYDITTASYKYDTLTDTYTKIANLPYYFSYGGVAVSSKTNIYLFGGSSARTGGQDAYRYDTLTDTYTKISDIPYKFTDYGGAVPVGDSKIYLFGGRSNPTKIQSLDIITVDFDDNSLVVQNGTDYKTQLYTNNKVDGRVLNYFANVYTYTDANGLQQIYNTYYGNGTSWVQIT